MLSPAPENRAGDNQDGSFTVHSGKPLPQLTGALVPTSIPAGKQAASVRSLTPAAWEQLTTLLFGGTANQPVLNGGNGGLAMAAAVPVTTAAEGKDQQGTWEQLTADLFEAAANEADLKNPMPQLWWL